MRASCQRCGAGHHVRDGLLQPGRAFRFACRTCGAAVVIGGSQAVVEPTTSPGFDLDRRPRQDPDFESDEADFESDEADFEPEEAEFELEMPPIPQAGQQPSAARSAWATPAMGCAGLVIGCAFGVGITLLLLLPRPPAIPQAPTRAAVRVEPATAVPSVPPMPTVATPEPLEPAAESPAESQVEPQAEPPSAPAQPADPEVDDEADEEAETGTGAAEEPAARRSAGTSWRRRARSVLRRCKIWHKRTWTLKQAVKRSATSADGDVNADLGRLRAHTTGHSQNKHMAVRHRGRKLVDEAGRDARYDDQRWLLGELGKECDGTGRYPVAP